MTERPPTPQPTFTELLELEELDRDLYRGINEVPANDRHNLYGGQVAAQALRAAGLTVPGDRYPHSMHGYFLRAGRRDRPVIFKVDRDRDGRSFSARRVAATQDGEVIFDLTASFHIDREGPDYLVPMRSNILPPEQCQREPFAHNFPNCEARLVPPTRPTEFGHDLSATLWVRVIEHLGDDRLMHCCGLAYMSDIGSGFAGQATPTFPLGGASLDHSMWFRSSARADDWCLLDLVPWMAGGSRGLYTGTMHAADGSLGASLTQEMLFRKWP